MGIKVHFANNYNQSQMIGLGVFFTILPIVAVSLRIWAKFLGTRGIKGDDILVFFGLVSLTGRLSRESRIIERSGFRHWLY